MSSDRAVGAPERLHPLFMVTSLGGSLRGLAGGYAFVAYLFVSGEAATGLAIGLGLLAFIVASLFVYWIRFQFRVGEDEIRIDSGFVNRTHRSIPFDRIQDVGISQGPVARLLGIAAVTFETGGSAGGEQEGILHAIPLQRAEELRELIRARRSSPSAQPVEASEARPVFAMSLGRLLLAGVFNFSLALFAGLFGLTQTMGDVLGFDPLDESFWRGLLAAGDPIATYAASHRGAAIMLGLGVLVAAGVLTGVVRTLLRDYGFRLDRTDVGLRRRRGLFTRTDVTLPVKRAQAAVIRTGPLRAAFGWRELKLQSLAQDEGSGDHVLAPLAKSDEAGAILREIGWPPVPPAPQWVRVSVAYIWTFVLAIAPLLLIFGLQAAAILALPALLPPESDQAALRDLAPVAVATLLVLGALVLAVGARMISWRRTGYLVDGDRLLVRSGWWRRSMVILPLARIQSIEIAQSFIGRWFRVSTLIFGVAGGGAGGHRIPAVPQETARQLREQLLV